MRDSSIEYLEFKKYNCWIKRKVFVNSTYSTSFYIFYAESRILHNAFYTYILQVKYNGILHCQLWYSTQCVFYVKCRIRYFTCGMPTLMSTSVCARTCYKKCVSKELEGEWRHAPFWVLEQWARSKSTAPRMDYKQSKNLHRRIFFFSNVESTMNKILC